MASRPNRKPNFSGMTFRDAAEIIIQKNKNRQIRAVKSEWRKFSEKRIQFFKYLVNSEKDFESIKDQYDIPNLCQYTDEGFLEQCLVACIDQEDKIWPLFDEFEKLFTNQTQCLIQFYETFILKLLELDKADSLHAVITHLENEMKESDNDKKLCYSTILEKLVKNSQLLMNACKKDNFDLVRALVGKGLRLYIPNPGTRYVLKNKIV